MDRRGAGAMDQVGSSFIDVAESSVSDSDGDQFGSWKDFDSFAVLAFGGRASIAVVGPSEAQEVSPHPRMGIFYARDVR